jgi:hypothetical protein
MQHYVAVPDLNFTVGLPCSYSTYDAFFSHSYSSALFSHFFSQSSHAWESAVLAGPTNFTGHRRTEDCFWRAAA